jgi:hypothetical protein
MRQLLSTEKRNPFKIKIYFISRIDILLIKTNTLMVSQRVASTPGVTSGSTDDSRSEG